MCADWEWNGRSVCRYRLPIRSTSGNHQAGVCELPRFSSPRFGPAARINIRVAIAGFESAAWFSANERESAFEDLLRSNEKRVLRTAWRLLGSLEDAKDASQEVFLRLHKHFERLEPATIDAWIYRTTVNVCMDHHRRRRPEGELDIDPPAPATQLTGLESDERKRRLERAISRLPEKERAALVLREIEGLETSRVAEILNVTDATVRSQVASAKSKLKEWLS